MKIQCTPNHLEMNIKGHWTRTEHTSSKSAVWLSHFSNSWLSWVKLRSLIAIALIIDISFDILVHKQKLFNMNIINFEHSTRIPIQHEHNKYCTTNKVRRTPKKTPTKNTTSELLKTKQVNRQTARVKVLSRKNEEKFDITLNMTLTISTELQ